MSLFFSLGNNIVMRCRGFVAEGHVGFAAEFLPLRGTNIHEALRRYLMRRAHWATKGREGLAVMDA